MAERLTAGIFDVGGVLIHFSPKDFHHGMMKASSIGTPTEKANYRRLWREVSDPLHTGQYPQPEISEQFKELTGVDLQLAEQPPDSLLTTVLSTVVTPNHEMLRIVSDLQANDVQTAILSDSIQPHASVIEASRVYEPFDPRLRILSHLVGIRKPNPAFYRVALDRLDVIPSGAFFVDDKQENVVAANNLGMQGIVFTNARQLRKDLRERGLPL